MSILKKNTKKTKIVATSYLGLYLPKELATYLTLYSLATGRSKTSIVIQQMKRWTAMNDELTPIDELLQTIVIKSFEKWNHPVGKRENFNTFKSMLKIELRNRSIEQHIDKIIELLEYEKNKEN